MKKKKKKKKKKKSGMKNPKFNYITILTTKFKYLKKKKKKKNEEWRSQHFTLFPFYPQSFNMKNKEKCIDWNAGGKMRIDWKEVNISVFWSSVLIRRGKPERKKERVLLNRAYIKA